MNRRNMLCDVRADLCPQAKCSFKKILRESRRIFFTYRLWGKFCCHPRHRGGWPVLGMPEPRAALCLRRGYLDPLHRPGFDRPFEIHQGLPRRRTVRQCRLHDQPRYDGSVLLCEFPVSCCQRGRLEFLVLLTYILKVSICSKVYSKTMHLSKFTFLRGHAIIMAI